ncbi:beta-galactosidase [Actinoplanes sp. TRM 88003]|uniref:beta-galactosidase n=1 Tax=Paractinoplanes aksuensis TaxID=2939490 RepID=A0ABT1DTF9_9ACTN|nr:beta-galactosidase [Actinoplanes aksuensis]MCO8274134.1 beta-galactosidase [Actinoplanes aksuensis]
MIWFGGDWNPEQWPSSVWLSDVELMRRAHVNLVTVGVFSWSRLQPTPEKFEFGWLDEVLDLLRDNGIGACLATPTASPPPWFTDGLPVTADGVALTYGSRDTYCVNAPAYLEASSRIASALASRYADHPAVRMWHVHNEYGTTCYCEHCAVAFRGWLFRAYGDPEALNAAWGTDFWSQRYASFAEVRPPRKTQYLSNPAHVLDYRRFVSDAMLDHYVRQREIVRPSGKPVTTNFALGGWVPVDHARWSREVDVVAVDDYPTSVAGHLDDRAFVADLARGWANSAGPPNSAGPRASADAYAGAGPDGMAGVAGGRPWMVMEHAPGAVLEQGVVRALAEGEAMAAAQAYVERGAVGVMYFQWRASRSGAEQWHPAVVPHEGPDTPVFHEIAAVGAAIVGRMPESPADTRALLYDEQTMWAWQSPHLPTNQIDYEATCRRWHRALGSPVDVLPVDAPLDGYRMVAAPLLHLMSAATHAALRSYVRAGGTLVLTFASALTDEHCRVTPQALDDLLGVRIVRRRPGDGHVWLDEVEPTTAKVQLRDPEDRPLVTEHSYGEGLVRFLATDLPDLDPWLTPAR